MTVATLQKKQEKMHEKIYEHAQAHGLIKLKPKLFPITDGIANIKGYLSSKPKIMWILKEPWGVKTPSGKISGGDWSFTTHFNDNNSWKDEDMWKVIIQINYAIHHNLGWSQLDFIDGNHKMIEELKNMAYINLSKIPAEPTSPASHLKDCYPIWREIVLEQIRIYEPDLIIFGYTFPYFGTDFLITSKSVHTQSGKYYTDIYCENKLIDQDKSIILDKEVILVDAYHPSRKGGENGSRDYVTSIVKGVQKVIGILS